MSLEVGLVLLSVLSGLGACGDAQVKPKPEPLPEGDAGAESLPEPPLDCRTSTRAQDADRDGYTPDRGDCDDCDPGVNPGALDFPLNGADEDCDGQDSTSLSHCDEALDDESDAPRDAARALGLCDFPLQFSTGWGVDEVTWKRVDGERELEDVRQVWLPERFGEVGPREGRRLLVLSTGVARDVSHPDYTRACDRFSSIQESMFVFTGGVKPPEGYPVDSSLCPEGTTGSENVLAYNGVGLDLKLRVPTNARSLSFDSIFFTYEYPDFVCSAFNDFFIVLVDSTPPGPAKGNVLFDAQKDPVGVNTALLSVCRESARSAREIACEQGPELLRGTGFDRDEAECGASASPDKEDIGGASTGWLHTTIPVTPGAFVTLHFMLWDSGDPDLDSSVAIDNMHFELPAVEEPSTGPITGGP